MDVLIESYQICHSVTVETNSLNAYILTIASNSEQFSFQNINCLFNLPENIEIVWCGINAQDFYFNYVKRSYVKKTLIRLENNIKQLLKRQRKMV